MSGRLMGKVAVVTGGCSGIGLGTVELFLAEGAKVVAADIQDEKGRGLERRFSGALRYAHCDVTREAEIEAALGLAESEFGGLDILYNNAGANGDLSAIETLSAEGWDRTLALLLRSVFLGTKHAIPLMKKRGGGSIINTASIAGETGGIAHITYSVAKGGVVHFTQSAAHELAPHRIRINAISPGMISTSIFGEVLGMQREDADRLAQNLPAHMASVQPYPKAGAPDDIARACLYFASDDSVFVTGTHLPVDGGYLVAQRMSDRNGGLFAALGAATAGLK